jgi:DNA polymerase-3 subunit epsilon
MDGKPSPSRLPGSSVVIHENLELARLGALVDGARGRLAQLESTYTIDKAKVDGSQARLFTRLRQHHQERERLRLIVSYRRQFLETLLRGTQEEAEQVRREYQEEKTQSDRDYEETASAMAGKKILTGEEEGELAKLWKELVKLYHPDRFAHEPDKLETYGKLTAAINRAKGSGDLDTLRQIASDPHGFILRQGWASLDFRDDEQVSRLRKLLESLEIEIARVIEATKQLHISAQFELYAIIEREPKMFDTVVARQIEQLEAERAKLTAEARKLAEDIETLSGQPVPDIH